MAQAAYTAIDSTIRAWVGKYDFTLYDSFEGFPDQVLRSVYLSSDRGECFQIWIEPPESGFVAVHAGDVETAEDREFRHDWKVPIAELGATLEAAVAHVKNWMNRE
jgi:hypothetical protein